MGKIKPKKRKVKLKQGKKRKQKLLKLRIKYLEAKTNDKKEEIIARIKKIQPYFSSKE